jgi:hypothetical protein
MNDSIFKTIVFSVIVSVFSSAVYSLIIGDKPIIQMIIITVISMLGIFTMIQIPFFRRLFITRAGLIDYRSNISVENSTRYWHKAKTDFMYVGVTGASIQEAIRRYIQNETNDKRRYRFLLIKPDGKAFRQQIAFEKGFDLREMTSEHEQIITSEIAAATQRLNAFIATINASRAAMNSPRRVEIRKYDEFTPWWVYVLDNHEIVLGLIIDRKSVV